LIWRVIPLTINDAATNMAIDSAILYEVSNKRSPPTLRIYRWYPSAVSLGYFQSVYEEVNLERCKKYGVDIVRRITGGGAVYHDFNGEITYSIILPERLQGIPQDIIKSYKELCKGIILALNELGLKAEFKPVNDIIVNGRKISGNAQTRKTGVILQHGTILMDLDVKKMFSVLNVSKEKISDKLIKSVEDRVTSIKKELGQSVTFENVASSLINGFSTALGFEYKIDKLTEEEETLEKQYIKNQFGNKKWTFKR